jgi:PhnB protein
MTSTHVPVSYSGANIYIVCKNAAEAITFYKEAFHANEVFRLTREDGGVLHAEIAVEGTRIMVGDYDPEWGGKTIEELGGSPVRFFLYVKNVEESLARALRAGAKEERPIEDMFWGDRMCSIVDPFGYQWSIAQHIRNVNPEEMQKAHEELGVKAG